MSVTVSCWEVRLLSVVSCLYYSYQAPAGEKNNNNKTNKKVDSYLSRFLKNSLYTVLKTIKFPISCKKAK